ncbi:Similar to X-element\ORF2: Probable RNA-directed DNA polymerase from transposon X-element (Drosophila melanogaster) [Cotesia congregata]|uniref:Similar to X-element\ORF2: Probable RNA-directed DNA polymerase from transposon X-element (Drosophila melanogaster) n=1 Tax=Cotesia congregata TaxID=51543 RepID=A0A8J2ME97_COTCN|nr:Similar to X-element\ORF2: Probable RNA-directed DNA polymerase from transposon X-element (Drosophila melanogaster) [Cotesia congregata]
MIQDHDILLLTETWLKPDEPFYINNYNIVRKDRQDGAGGGSYKNSAQGKELLETITEADLCILNDGSPTRVTNPTTNKSAVDLTIVSPELLSYINWNVSEDPGRSDHYQIHISMGVALDTYQFFTHKLNLSKICWETFDDILTQKVEAIITEDNLNVSPTYEEIITIIKDSLSAVTKTRDSRKESASANQHTSSPKNNPKTRKIRTPAPWWNEECSKALEERKSALQFMKRTLTVESYENYNKISALTKKTFQKAKQNAWREYTASLNSTTPIAMVWKKFQAFKNKRLSTPYTLPRQELSVEQKKLESIESYYQESRINSDSSIAQELFHQDTSEAPQPSAPNFPDYEISLTELNSAIRRSKLGTSPGLDQPCLKKKRKLYFVTNSGLTEPQEVNSGAGQGLVSAPLLFTLYTADGNKHIHSSSSIAEFADDKAIRCRNKNLQYAVDALQASLDSYNAYLESLDLDLSPEKTKIVVFSLIDFNPQDIVFAIKNIHIRPSTSAKFLGMTLDQKLTFDEHYNNLISRINKVNPLIKAMCGTKWGAAPATLLNIYRALIRTKIEYGSHIMNTTSSKSFKKLEKIQNKAIRTCMGLRISTPINSMMAEENEISLKIRLKDLSDRYILRSISVSDNPVIQTLTKLKGSITQNKAKHKEKAINRTVEFLKEVGKEKGVHYFSYIFKETKKPWFAEYDMLRKAHSKFVFLLVDTVEKQRTVLMLIDEPGDNLEDLVGVPDLPRLGIQVNSNQLPHDLFLYEFPVRDVRVVDVFLPQVILDGLVLDVAVLLALVHVEHVPDVPVRVGQVQVFLVVPLLLRPVEILLVVDVVAERDLDPCNS